MKKISLINGPNLNLLGEREQEIYGSISLEEIEREMSERSKILKIELTCFQSNSEGEIIDFIQDNARKCDGFIINPGGLTHYSVSLRDALLAVRIPTIEVHISNIYAREDFRSKSVISDIALGQISGLGADGYLYALEWHAKHSPKT